MYYLIIFVALVVFSSSAGLLFWGLSFTDSDAISNRLQGAAAISTVIPSFAGVLLASIAIYMYVKIEDPIYQKSVEILYNKDILDRLIDDVPKFYLSSVSMGSSFYARNRDHDEATEKRDSYFSMLVSDKIDRLAKIILETPIMDICLKSNDVNHTLVIELTYQIQNYNNLLKNKTYTDPLTGGPVVQMVCLTCEQLKDEIKKMDFASLKEVYSILSKPCESDQDSYEDPAFVELFKKVKIGLGITRGVDK